MKGFKEFGCGQCLGCRINRSRLWVGRLVLESYCHPFSCFVTLTYDEDHLPKDKSVSRVEMALFLKRLRKQLWPRQVRFYGVGEYGEQSWRPHYHLILFGVHPGERELLEKCWSSGFVHIGTVEEGSLQYVCGYITKKMTKPDDARLQGRSPEFSSMSLKPGIGSGYVPAMVEEYRTERGQAALKAHGWIIQRFAAQGSMYPIHLYLKKKIIEQLGLTKVQASEYKYRVVAEMREKLKHIKTRKGWRTLRESQLAAQVGKRGITERSL